jgi:hypothetical protein
MDPVTDNAEVIRRKPTAFANKIIRAGMEQENVWAARLQTVSDLTDFVWRGRTQITSASETYPAKVKP